MASSRKIKQQKQKYPSLDHKPPAKNAAVGQLPVWLDWGAPKPSDYEFDFNLTWAACYRAIRVYELQGVGRDIYYEWAIDPVQEDAFWRAINPPAELQDALREHPNQTRPIYVEATHGHPLGHYMYQLSCDPRRLWSLFIASRGQRNMVPCQKCDKRYRSAIGGMNPNSPTSVMWPFFECVSLKGRCRDGCANCVWGQLNSCTYNHGNFKSYVGACKVPEKLYPDNALRGSCIQDKMGSISQIVHEQRMSMGQQDDQDSSGCSPQ